MLYMGYLKLSIKKDGVVYYLYVTHQPVFDKKTGEHLYHEYVISYVSGNKILTLVRNQDFEKAVQSTIDELEKL